jgi:ATP-dependent RNA helicase SUPV3L1/SUV3
MSDRSTGLAPSKLTAVLGPTNTGKTHLAVERMLGHASGMIGLPLRLLAREIYDRIVKLRGKASVALITGEEKIVPPRAAYFVCTVEAMPLTREVEFVAIDEIQLCADPERGHIFTHRLLHARGKYETMLLGAGTMAPLVRRLLPDAEIVTRERFSNLTYSGSKKLTRLPRRSAVVAFSTDAVYAIAELIRRQRGGAAVVMGSAEPPHPQRPGRALPVRRGRLPGGHRRHRHGPEHGRRPRGLRRPAQVRRQAHPLAAPQEVARSPAGPGATPATARSG